MFSTAIRLVTRSRVVLASSLVLATSIVSIGVAAPSSSAASNSSFCQLMLTYKPVSAPTSITTGNYRSWAKATLPFFEQLAADAPNAKTKSELNALVTILKYEEDASTTKALETYVGANSVKFANDAKALADAIIACAE